MNPLVSIIVPTHNNEATILRTLNSLMEQTLSSIEIVIVDDASTDMTLPLCQEAQRLDSRISVVPLDSNETALQCRRIGVERSEGRYVMFCDSDDEMAPQAAEEASAFALGGGYDVVHFGTTILSATGSTHTAWERALDPFGTELFGKEILLASPFGRPGAKINGSVWNKLYERELVARAWQSIDPALRLLRAQDVYQTLLILSKATRYGGLPSALYRYNFGAGKSGNRPDRESFRHFLASASTYEVVSDYVNSSEWTSPHGFDSVDMLDRLRDQFIANQLNYWFQLPRPAHETFAELLETWGPESVLSVLARKHPDQVRTIVEACSRLGIDGRADTPPGNLAQPPHHIALLGNILGLGGVQKVMAKQAEILVKAGHTVSVISFDHGPEDHIPDLPPSVMHRTLGPRGNVDTAVPELMKLIREEKYTALLNHDNYSNLFPWSSIVTRTLGLRSALFLHSFSLRGLYDFNERFSLLPEIAKNYDVTVTLSEADRMWWRASGVPHVHLLPNYIPDLHGRAQETNASTPSEVFDSTLAETEISRSELLWVGRLQDSTKNASGLIEIFAQVVSLRPDTTLSIVGGEQTPGEQASLEQLAQRLGVRDRITFVGPTNDVDSWYSASKVLISTSTIEGFPLTLAEAQSHGLPVVMYDLPYLEIIPGNPGILAAEWGASESLAQLAVDILNDPTRRAELGISGREFVQKFSIGRYTEALNEIVNELLAGSLSVGGGGYSGNQDTVIVPAALINEFYRLYEKMQARVSLDLNAAKRESADSRKNLLQLKRAVSESKAKHHQLESMIAGIEKTSKRAKPPAKVATSTQMVPSDSFDIGLWPLWGREGSQPFENLSRPPFLDVSVDDPIAIPVAWAQDTGILRSPATGRFDGPEELTRYELLRMLHCLAGSPTSSPQPAIYGDLDPHDPVISWASRRAIVTGPKASGEAQKLPVWKPSELLQRGAAAMFLYRAAGRPTYRAPSSPPYPDIQEGQKSYKEMCWVAHQGVLQAFREEDGTLAFREEQSMTRSDVVLALFRQMVGPTVSFGSD